MYTRALVKGNTNAVSNHWQGREPTPSIQAGKRLMLPSEMIKMRNAKVCECEERETERGAEE